MFPCLRKRNAACKIAFKAVLCVVFHMFEAVSVTIARSH